MKALVTFLILIIYGCPALARPIEVNVTNYGFLTSFPLLKDVLDFYVQDVENDINGEQPLINPQRLNYGTANSSVLAAKGLGTDYVSEPKKFQISLGVGAAYDAEENKAIRDEISGAAVASSVTLGLRLDQFGKATILGLDSKRLMGYVNFGSITQSKVLPGEEVDLAGNITATNFGLHVRYDLIEQKGSEWLGWGGLKVHTGYEYSLNTVNLKTELDEEVEIDTGGAGILTGRLIGQPEYQIKTVTHSIPLELSTSLLFLKMFSLYTGGGADHNFGQSVGKGDVKGDVSTLACSSGLCLAETDLPQIEAQANYDSKSQVKTLNFRVFGGVQIDLPLGLHAFAQVEKMLGTEVIGAGAGLKYTY